MVHCLQHDGCYRRLNAPQAMHQPAKIGGQLLGVRPGRQHAVVQSM